MQCDQIKEIVEQVRINGLGSLYQSQMKALLDESIAYHNKDCPDCGEQIKELESYDGFSVG